MITLFSKIELTKLDNKKFTELLGCEPIIANLLLNIPASYQFATQTSKIDNIEIGTKIITNVTVEKHSSNATFGSRFSKMKVHQIIVVTDDGMPITLMFFKIFPSQIVKMAVGTRHCIEGKLEAFGAMYKIMHPKITTPKIETNINLDIADKTIIKPIYRMSAELSQNKIHNTIQKALDLLPEIDIPEWNMRNLSVSFKDAILRIHRPQNAEDIGVNSPFRKRLAFDELFASQISLKIARNNVAQEKHIIINGNSNLRTELLAQLPFKLTDSQQEVLAEIYEDQKKQKRMFRLLQGDVGSGKTLVCLLACLNAVECGKKAVIMAPTTILAMQHAKYFNNILPDLNIVLLTSRTTAKQYKIIQKQLNQGEIDILVGTHSVINDDLPMPEFGLIVVDEQHRFGVKQRLKLFQKADESDVLMMTATPIPRTLAMMNYGDIDISIIKHKPANRKPIDTRIVNINRYDEILQSFKRGIENGEKIYWICPMIEENEDIDLANTTKRKIEFEEFFGTEKVGMIHGKMKEKERDDILLKFLNCDIKILVATTVVEVGINIPDVTIIAIEHADRFGLSQLHQLRGRVGRSDKASYCFLLYDNNTTANGKKRLKVIKDTEDGFEIAKEDLKIRGTGDLIGIKQSGFADFKIANFLTDLDLLQKAANDANKAIIDIKNPIYAILLEFFEYKETIDLLRG